MSKSTYGVRRAGLAGLATMSLVTAAAVAGAGAASAVADFKFQRIGGVDRYETSADIADAFATTNPDVILTNGEPGNYADALSANTLAGELNVPILLTKADKTPDFILAQLAEDGVKNITVVGGESVVTPAQVASLESKGYKVTRVSGSDRFLTNAEVIKKSGTAKSATGLIATGFNFPDALAAGPVSVAGHPLGLSTGDDIDQEVIDALKAVGVTKVLIFGGEAAVSPAVAAKLAANQITVTQRFAGSDRSQTSTLAAEYAVANLGFKDTHVGVASGYVNGFGADALAGGPLEGKETSPMLVTRDVNNPGSVVDYLKKHANTLEDGHLYGGPAAISTAAQAAMEKAAQSTTTNQDFTVTPSSNQSKPSSDTTATNEGRMSFTVTGLDDTKVYDLALFPCANVTTDASGVTTFKDADGIPAGTGDDKADGKGTSDTGAAHIENVNNGAPTTDDITPVNGTITFTVDSEEADCAVAVLWDDTANDDALTLDANNQPTDKFVNTGDLVWTATEAASGPFNGTVVSVDKTANTFALDTAGTPAADNTYNYDGNDSYTVLTSTGQSMAQFEAALSVGDSVMGVYNTDPDGVSSFDLYADTPAAPTVDAAQGTGQNSNDITLTITPTDPTSLSEYDSFKIERAVVTGGTDEGTNGTLGAYTVIANPTTDADTTAAGFQYVDQNVAAGMYRYRVSGVVDGDTGAAGESTNEVSTNPAAQDTTAPTITSASVTDDTGIVGVSDNGDDWELIFSEDMADAVGAAGTTFRVQDGDGTIADIVCGTGVTCTLQDNNASGTAVGVDRVLLIALTATPTPITGAAGTVPGLQYPLTITNVSSNVDDQAGNQLNLAGSADKVIN